MRGCCILRFLPLEMFDKLILKKAKPFETKTAPESTCVYSISLLGECVWGGGRI